MARTTTLAAMEAKTPNFIEQERVLYESTYRHCASYNATLAEAVTKVSRAIADGNAGSSASWMQPVLGISNADMLTLIVDLTCTCDI